ncbi:type II toxin-antitoxin system HipA family toxin [Marinobacter bryozoorum]|uniref:type II toxin-antitoxin system HipA family toxin n=1 Tax=Marinobacter bryozoorum TaxID=256324 RepID=UPI0020054AD5|nr:type II toxin-antitoxin system HipA family toxin [Marinobacter bryozoorum]MCK7546068.1 type II toxin-antitoxin system HipA family toxin [Marinobacter bryozoorum]
MTRLKRALVEVDGQVVGDLVAPGRPEPSVFVYDNGVGEERAVSVTMPVKGQAFSYNGLHPIFAQNLPEGYLGDVIRKYVAKLYGAGDLAVLAALGRHQVGRVVVTDSAISDPVTGARGEPLSRLLKTDDASLFDELVEKYALRSGVSGVQPKVLVPGHISEKSSVRTAGFIVKTWGDDYPQLAANEFFCMSLARLCGLPVPEFHLSDDGRLFVMARFDRDVSGGGAEPPWLGFEDGCVLQGLMPEDKYSGSYEKLAKSFDTFLSSEHRRQGLKWLFMSVAVSWAVRNGDAHLKNFGLLYRKPFAERWMAPAYDIVSTTPYLPGDVPALTLSGRKVWWPVQYLVNFGCQSCGLPRKDVATFLKTLAGGLLATADQMQSYYERNQEFREVGECMVATFRSSAVLLQESQPVDRS